MWLCGTAAFLVSWWWGAAVPAAGGGVPLVAGPVLSWCGEVSLGCIYIDHHHRVDVYVV